MLGSDSTPLVVLLASVLKPVDDPRMRGKFAQTLLERPNTRVHVAGRSPGDDLDYRLVEDFPRIHHHRIFRGSRLSLNRLVAQWRYWQLLHRLQPALVIVHAPELLPLTLLWQRLGHGRKFIYDIRENYALNVLSQQVYQGLTRRWLAAGLRRVEGWAAQWAAGIILAEQSYAQELPYLQKLPAGRVVVLENKYQPAAPETAQPAHPLLALNEPLRLLYSGTISELNGVLDAVAFAQKLHAAWPGGTRLTIIGFCQQPALLARLRQLATENTDWLTLIGGDEIVPHAAIVEQIQLSQLGLLPYRPHASTWRCLPTKLFEYLANGLPVLIPDNAYWSERVRQYDAGLVVAFDETFDAAQFVPQLALTSFYRHGLPTDVLWASEGTKLLSMLDSIR